MPKGGSKPGERRGGRKAGTLNKTTQAAKEAIELVFDDLGGADALRVWASSNPDNMKSFYVQIWPKVLPLQVNGAGKDGEHVITSKIVREVVHTKDTNG
jgi:hypothetical protein